MDNLDSLIKRVRCSVHHGEKQNYLSIDPKTFKVICTLCAKEKNKGKKKNLIIVDPELNNNEDKNELENIQMPDNEDSNHFCYKHKSEPSLFYCEDCAQFICKTCFATEHRNHSSSTFELISEIIKNNVNKLYEKLETLNKALESNNESLEEKNKYFEDKKKNIKSNLDNINNHISKALEEKSKEYNNEIESFFNGFDKEVESNLNKLELKKKTTNKMYEEFKKMENDIKEINDDHKICLYKKDKDELINENHLFLSDIKNFLKDQLNQTKEKVEKEEEKFREKCENFKKNLEIYESSVINTMKSGIPCVCSRIRRLYKFSLDKSKFFKKDSLCMIVSNSINLVGMSICGLYHEHDQPIKTYKINLKIYEVKDANNFGKDSKELVSIDVDIPTITNYVDPVYQFYLDKSYLLDKDKFYFIILTNLSDDTFINTWSGTIYKDKKAEACNQTNIVVSNNDNITFTFMNAFGIESDLNEFSNGLISDIIYSTIE